LCIQVGVLKGAKTYAECLRLVFGDRRKRWLDPLDTDPERLKLLLRFVSANNEEELLTNHSTWPYFNAFKDVTVSGVLEIGKKGLCAQNAMGLTGTQPISDTRMAKYCPHCAAEQSKKYGRTTWLRSHHLPGVSHCYRHGNALSESSLWLVATNRKQEEIIFPVPSVDDGNASLNEAVLICTQI
jgi:hypothetical protein